MRNHQGSRRALLRVTRVGAVLLLGACSSPSQDTAAAPTADGLDGLLSVRIEPSNATLEVTDQAGATFEFRAIGTFAGGGERDLTAQARFGISPPVAAFTGARLAAAAGAVGAARVTVDFKTRGEVGSADVLVHLTVRRNAAGGLAPLPADPASRFTGAPDAARAPSLVYPNDGVMLPPNVRQLEVHFRPGSAANTLFEIAFTSRVADLRVYARCGAPVDGGCVHALDPALYGYLARAHAGGEPASLRVRGASDGDGAGYGESGAFSLRIAQQDVQGGLYYWTTSGNTGILRVDFGGASLTPEPFLSPAGNRLPACVGCHAISRDGTRMVASLGGQNDGRLIHIADLTRGAQLDLDGTTPASATNHAQFSCFSPDGNRIAAVYGDTADLVERTTLWMHDGATGVRLPGESMRLPFEADHPDWSPSGKLLALTRVGIHQTSQRPFNCGLELLSRDEIGWSAPSTLVPIVPGRTRFNPSFAPDSAFLTYTEATCPGGNDRSNECDGDSDPTATTWAIPARTGSTPLRLARAGTGGVADAGRTALSDTFARFSPFSQTEGSGRLFWVTISSTRRGGLRDSQGRRWLWMFALDPDKVERGEDGSYPAFFLPFQDLATSNHLAQWTQKVIAPF